MTVKRPDFVDPKSIPQRDLPLIVLSDGTTGLVQWAIKWRTNASYNHVMIMNKPNIFVSQESVYHEIPLSKYLKKNCRLKFWQMKINENEKKIILDTIEKQLKENWYKRSYDYLGILGQITGWKWINTPWKDYCSERTADTIRQIFPYIPSHPSPEDLNEIFKEHPEHFQVYGKWEED